MSAHTQYVCIPVITDDKRLNKQEDEQKTKCDVSICVSELEDCLREVLSDVLEVEMKAAYEDLWLEVKLCFGISLLVLDYFNLVYNRWARLFMLAVRCVFFGSQIVYLKPPWTLQDVLRCLKKHWIAVFGHIAPRRKEQTVTNLINFFNSGMYVCRSKHYYLFHCFSAVF